MTTLEFGNTVKSTSCLRYGGPCTGGPDESCGECSGMTAVHEQRQAAKSKGAQPGATPNACKAGAGADDCEYICTEPAGHDGVHKQVRKDGACTILDATWPRDTDSSGHDWTVSDEGQANSSPYFLSLVDEVAMMVANARVGDDPACVARTIMAQLAHVHGLVPTTMKGCV